DLLVRLITSRVVYRTPIRSVGRGRPRLRRPAVSPGRRAHPRNEHERQATSAQDYGEQACRRQLGQLAARGAKTQADRLLVSWMGTGLTSLFAAAKRSAFMRSALADQCWPATFARDQAR